MQLRSKRKLSELAQGDESELIESVKPKQKQFGGDRKKRLTMHKLPLTCVCIDSTNQHAFTASKDGSIIRWGLECRKMLNKVDAINKSDAQKDNDLAKRRHVKHITAIAISSDDKFLATGGWDRHIRIWSPADLSWLHTFTLHRNEITALAFRQDQPTLYSGSNDRSIMIWSLEDDENRCFVEALYGHESPITSMDCLRKERVLSSGGLDQTIRIWKIVEQAQTVFTSSHRSVDIARLIDDKTFVSGGEDGSISVWTSMKRKPLVTKKQAHGVDEDVPRKENKDNPFASELSYWVLSLAVYPLQTNKKNKMKSRKKRKVAEDQEVVDYDFDASENEDDGDKDEDQEESEEQENGLVALIASGSCDSKLKLWNLVKQNGKYELKLKESLECPGFINDMKFTSDGCRLIAVCGQEHRLGRWWRLNTKNRMHIFEINKNNTS